MERTVPTITEIRPEDASEHAPTVGLDNVLKEFHAAALLERLRQVPGTRTFLLIWTGSKVPRGASLFGWEITWAQHGRVHGRDADGHVRELGTYSRLEEWGGDNKDRHQMIIHVRPQMCVGEVDQGVDVSDTVFQYDIKA